MIKAQRSRSLLAILLYSLTAALVLAWLPKAPGIGADDRPGLSWPKGVPMTSANLRRILPAKGFLKEDDNSYVLPRCSLPELYAFLGCTEYDFKRCPNLAPPGTWTFQYHAWFARNDFLCLVGYAELPTPGPNARLPEVVQVEIVLDYTPPQR